jgi:hypothetical protein
VQLSGDECVDWGIGWQSVPSHHRHSTSVQNASGSELLGSSEHSQQHESGNCWGAESPSVVG